MFDRPSPGPAQIAMAFHQECRQTCNSLLGRGIVPLMNPEVLGQGTLNNRKLGSGGQLALLQKRSEYRHGCKSPSWTPTTNTNADAGTLAGAVNNTFGTSQPGLLAAHLFHEEAVASITDPLPHSSREGSRGCGLEDKRTVLAVDDYDISLRNNLSITNLCRALIVIEEMRVVCGIRCVE